MLLMNTHYNTSAVSLQARGSEAACVLASGRLGNPAALRPRRPAAGGAEGRDPGPGPGRAEEAEPQRPPQAEPGQGAFLPGREMLRPLQAALPTPLQLLRLFGRDCS